MLHHEGGSWVKGDDDDLLFVFDLLEGSSSGFRQRLVVPLMNFEFNDDEPLFFVEIQDFLEGWHFSSV